MYLHFSIFVSHFKGKHKLKNADTFCCHQFLSSKIMNIAIKKMPFSQHFFTVSHIKNIVITYHENCHQLPSFLPFSSIHIHPFSGTSQGANGFKWYFHIHFQDFLGTLQGPFSSKIVAARGSGTWGPPSPPVASSPVASPG